MNGQAAVGYLNQAAAKRTEPGLAENTEEELGQRKES